MTVEFADFHEIYALLGILVANVLLGMVSGFLAGLFGIGGGLVIVPALVFLFTAQGFLSEHVMIMAVATSLASIILTAIASVMAHNRLGSVVWPQVFRLTPGILLGALLGSKVADSVGQDALRLCFTLFLMIVGARMAFGASSTTAQNTNSLFADATVSVLIGFLSALVGIGGGTLTVPYLARGGFPMRNAVAISSACGLPIAISAALSYVALGIKAAGLPPWSVGYVYVPSFVGIGLGSVMTASLGAKLAHRWSSGKLKRAFAVLILLVAVKMAGTISEPFAVFTDLVGPLRAVSVWDGP